MQDINNVMKLTAVIEKCPSTDLYVAYVPSVPGAHSQGKTLDKVMASLKEVLQLLMESDDLVVESEIVGLQTLEV